MPVFDAPDHQDESSSIGLGEMRISTVHACAADSLVTMVLSRRR